MIDGEKRGSTRESITLVVEYDGAEALLGDYTANLSDGGTFVQTDREFEVGQQVRLVLSFPGLVKPMAIAGEIRHVCAEEHSRGIGVAFIDSGERAQLGLLVERIRTGDPSLVARVVRVLIVEDNPHVARLIEQGLTGGSKRKLLGEVVMKFETASNGQEAVETLDAADFDALVIDIYLPILDGASVIRYVRSHERISALPIIAVSAGGKAAREAALSAGANFFLEKPMRLRQVLDSMRKLIALAEPG